MLSWRYALRFHNVKISFRTAIISHGLSIFAKYIPGKIWVILGRASYVSNKGFGLKETSFISLKEQLLYILIGLIISSIPTLWFFKVHYISFLLLGTCIALGLILFNKWVHDLTEKILAILFRKEFNLPRLNIALSGRLSLFIILYWMAWIVAFYFFCLSILPDSTVIFAFAFPLSVCYGVLAIIVPGGLGVREGIMVAFLVAVGANAESVVTLSVISRLWFIGGEAFSFLLSLLLKLSEK